MKKIILLTLFILIGRFSFGQLSEDVILYSGGPRYDVFSHVDNDGEVCGNPGNLDVWDSKGEQRIGEYLRNRVLFEGTYSGLTISGNEGGSSSTDRKWSSVFSVNPVDVGTFPVNEFDIQEHFRDTKTKTSSGPVVRVDEKCEYIQTTYKNLYKAYNIRVEAKPALKAAQNQICKNQNSFNLFDLVDTPGGWFEIVSISSSQAIDGATFNPSIYTSKSIEFYYKKTYNNGITTLDFQVDLVDIPSISLPANATLCSNAAAIDPNITYKPSPGGGTWSIAGNNVSVIDPSITSGKIDLTYSITQKGCSASKDMIVTVNQPSELTLPSIANLCSNGSSIALKANPSAWLNSGNNNIKVGSWTTANPGAIKVSNTFPIVDSLLPKYLNVGDNIVTYNYTATNGCKSSKDITIKVFDSTAVPFTDTPPVCLTGTSIDLSTIATKQGGLWSGNGVTGNSFSPSKTGVGKYKLLYTYMNASGCKSRNVYTQEVLPAVTSFTGAFQDEGICNNTAPFDLNKRINPYPGPGDWTGQGVNNNTFDPAGFAAGTKITLTYTFKSGNGCAGTKNKNIVIGSGPAIPAMDPLTLCRNDKTVALHSNPDPTGKGPFIFNSIIDVKRGYWTGDGTINNKWASFSNVPGAYPYGLYGDSAGNGIVDISKYPNYSFLDSLNPKLAKTGSIQYNYITVSGSGNTFVTCVSTGSMAITIIDTLDIAAIGKTDYCINDSLVNLSKVVSVPGGTFSYNGQTLAGATLDPTKLKPGKNSVQYRYVDKTTGCSSRAVIDILIKEPPTVTGFFDDAKICKNADAINLYLAVSPFPFGGTWYGGAGLVGTNFNPALTSRDTTILDYKYVDNGTQCSVTKHKKYIVVSPDNITLQTSEDFCTNSGSSALAAFPAQWSYENGAYKKRGVWTGFKIKTASAYPALDSIYPAKLTGGDFQYVYTYTNKDNCVSRDTLSFSVNDTTAVLLGGDTSICKNDSPISLGHFASVPGGQFQYRGSYINTFTPSTAALGNNIVNYIYYNKLGCRSVSRKSFIVKANPFLSGAVDTVIRACTNSIPIDLSIGATIYPDGGVYSGPSVINGIFNPAKGLSTNLMKYTVAANGCSSTGQFKILLSPPTDISVEKDQINACKNDPKIALVASPVTNSKGVRTGHWTGSGIIQSKNLKPDTLDPTKAKVGSDTLTYSYTDDKGCTAKTSILALVSVAPSIKITVNKSLINIGDPVEFMANEKGADEVTYRWDFGDGSVAYVENPWHYFYGVDSSTIRLNVVTALGCTTTTVSTIKIKGNKTNQIITYDDGNTELPNGFIDYFFVNPVPAKDQVTVNVYLSQAEKMNLKLVTMQGYEIPMGDRVCGSGETQFPLDLSLLPSGVYNLIMKGDRTSKSFKIIKE